MHLKKEKQTMVLPLKLNLKGRFQIFILGDSNGDLTRALISGKPVYIKKHTQQSISMLRKICKSIDPCNLVTKSWELLWQKKRASILIGAIKCLVMVLTRRKDGMGM